MDQKAEDKALPQNERTPQPGPCAKIVGGAFGALFLIVLLAVPVTTRTAQLRRDPGSNIIVRTTFPRKGTMFLPLYPSAKARSRSGADLRIRSAQWVATMAIVLMMGGFDYFVVCRLLRRRLRPAEPGPGAGSGLSASRTIR